ncbi:hypothetical protein Pint_07287 [Pistacia integerrima]|uniref:Uncharacterized protein n=1 Tax=Pistacia integerrima TaxID=434235 RepID=A0ACC0XTS2_9ROSI|nr:hypothetical protein Pint_07287 [Pistacia integerrima]
MSEDMIFTRDEDGSFYTYDFTLEVMTKVETEKECFLPSDSYFPHAIKYAQSFPVIALCISLFGSLLCTYTLVFRKNCFSRAFHLGGQGLFLFAQCNMDQQSSFHCFGLFLGMQEKGPVIFAVDYEFATRSKPTEEFVSKYKDNYTFTGGKADWSTGNLFAIQWTSFMAEDNLYFINGILHLRAELTIRH